MTYWGRILNPNKYDIKEEDPITFQSYDIKNDRTFAKHTYPRSEILSFALAKTIKNEIEFRKRKVAWIQGTNPRFGNSFCGFWTAGATSRRPSPRPSARSRKRSSSAERSRELGDPRAALRAHVSL